ncbi:MAG: hypothetical protein II931_01255, partial [Clostridia bacterium]|nr:hypothetical protein [Clostridia bacterium]
HKSKEENSEKKVEKIVTGSVRSKKKNELNKLADVFIAEDISNVKSYILQDIIIPAIKTAISDVVTNGIDMILYGETGKTKKSTSSRVSYRDYYSSNDRKSSYSSASRRSYSYDDIILDNRAEAEEVLVRMDELIEAYGVASVGDLYDLVGLTGDYTDNKYGWTNLRSAQAVRVRDGYLLKLPKALPLN